ncbi:MAG: ParB/RepB/Spo0J family partition protein [Leptospirales bacterium]
MAKNGLGRGLDSLFESEGPEKKEDILLIPLADIQPNPFQPRKIFREEEIRDMAESLQNHGLLQPIVIIRREGDGPEEYILVSGERRFRAAKSLGWEKIPAILRAAGDRDLLELALVENLQRSDLNPVEVAEGFNRLIEEFQWSQEELARHLGMKRSTVANFLRVLTLPSGIVQKIEQGAISLGHAKVLLGVKDSQEQLALEKEIVQKNLSVRELESRISQKQSKKEVPSWAKRGKEVLSSMLARPVSISRAKNKVKFTVAIENEQEFAHFLKKISAQDLVDQTENGVKK